MTGSELYSEIAPIIAEELTDGKMFSTKVAAKISEYVVKNDSMEGGYVGFMPSGIPSTQVVAGAIFKPNSVSFPEPKPTDDFKSWIKEALNSTLTWQAIPDPKYQHQFAPIDMKPLSATIEILVDLSDIITAEGIWALISDVLIVSILSAPQRATPVDATASDGSSGTIIWVPTQVPDLVHNFKIYVYYDLNNLKLVQYIKKYRPETDLSGQIPIPLNSQPYAQALAEWKIVKSLTSMCSFMKIQDDGTEITLDVGTH